ncbi:hypothetical protein C5C36_00945 [Rathayibacter sp. AY1G1]|uniref:ComF family protein n=1 Tax=unclassified Rathayibacter TaxID=2609250 RepID=UPI000CE7570F|nr:MULTISPECIES: hypothetical protein [unclassified Rathayibacter]PPG44692.1 hypothetical protein C5C30_00290 [Rathayibacter sp. AY2B5]PPG55256.1 hypothetical protein C5C41_01320 [Rathayibacter sp. AY1E9]PPG61699.1 hypothetical protein C5C57_01340 [Rathayibacter sp. AY1C5]PPH15885.1 hypothetical protein C5C36_00945 [Rathayibacter sp. AY1G1]PPH43174.1 hypothetical protein C5C86_02180 [Rathayibacter sp. AY1E4]
MLSDHLLDALAVLLPLECPACGEPTSRAPCPDCSADAAASACLLTRVVGPPDDPLLVVTGGPYEGTVRRLVVALKEEGRTACLAPLGALLRPALGAALAGSPAILVVPPGSWLGRVRRGADPVAQLVAAAGGRAARPLRRSRMVRDQVGLGRIERRGNLDGAFRARRPLSSWPPVVLVDDVVTSGATLLELRRAVRAAGGTVRAAAALAGTAQRGGNVAAESGRTPGDDPVAGVYGGGTA